MHTGNNSSSNANIAVRMPRKGLLAGFRARRPRAVHVRRFTVSMTNKHVCEPLCREASGGNKRSGRRNGKGGAKRAATGWCFLYAHIDEESVPGEVWFNGQRITHAEAKVRAFCVRVLPYQQHAVSLEVGSC